MHARGRLAAAADGDVDASSKAQLVWLEPRREKEVEQR
jgi:hypothetical protein